MYHGDPAHSGLSRSMPQVSGTLRVIKQVKLLVFCEDDQAERAVQLIRLHGRTGQSVAGWVYQSTVDQAWPIDGRVDND